MGLFSGGERRHFDGILELFSINQNIIEPISTQQNWTPVAFADGLRDSVGL